MYTCGLEYGHSMRQADCWCETLFRTDCPSDINFEARTECPTRTFCADKIRTDRSLIGETIGAGYILRGHTGLSNLFSTFSLYLNQFHLIIFLPLLLYL